MYDLYNNYKYETLNKVMLGKGFKKLGQSDVLGSINNTYYVQYGEDVFYSRWNESINNLSFEYRMSNVSYAKYEFIIDEINCIGFSFSRQEDFEDELLDLYQSEKDKHFVVFVLYKYDKMKVQFIRVKGK